ncbi:MAG: PilX N-terminal domain-containing pilus assembly protein [Candidatus Zixiibacteriota bacterium]
MSWHMLSKESGSTILVVLLILLMMTLIGTQMISTSVDDVTLSGNVKNAAQAFYSAEAGQALARSTLWADYVNSSSTNPLKVPGEVGNRAAYTGFLDKIGLVNNGTLTLGKNQNLAGGQVIESVLVQRQDQAGSTVLTVSSVGKGDQDASQTITAVYRVEGEAFRGFDFAILAKNVNCIMCHATIDNVDRTYNGDPAKQGTFDRVKVASLESMLLRTTSAQSYVAGTVYTRGIVTDKAGNPITNLSPTGQGLNGYAISSTDGTIQEPMNTVSLTNTTGTPLPQYGNLYMNYPSTDADMTDGKLPDQFPPPFPDDNGNKVVDDAEYADVALNSSGSISGGVIYSVPQGSTYGAGALPGAGNQTGINQSYDGNLILVGTTANPIEISGDIAVNGDVIIQGVVKGTGQIFARGNVYMTGDVTYADGTKNGTRTFGMADDGTQNALSLAAGKNVLVGDYLTPSGGNINSSTSIDPGNLSGGEKFSFTMSEMTLFNRGEWTKTQQFLPDKNGALVPNATYDPSYVPRYYTMNSGDPVYIYNKPKGGTGTYWDPASNSWQGKEHASSYDLTLLTKLDPGDAQLTNAKTVALSSTNNWISAQNLKNLWIADEAARPAGSDFKIDGQMYTNNSIFALTRSTSKNGGKMIVNGAMVAADVGVLVPNSLKLNYDQRLKTFLKIKDDSKVAMDQSAWYSE